jgi:hypothetical protein
MRAARALYFLPALMLSPLLGAEGLAQEADVNKPKASCYNYLLCSKPKKPTGAETPKGPAIDPKLQPGAGMPKTAPKVLPTQPPE